MKRLIIYVFIAIVAAISMQSCEQSAEGAVYDAADGTGFSFAAPVLNMETDADDDNMLLIPIYRSETSGELVNVTFEIYDPDNADNDNEGYVSSDPNKIFRLATSRVFFAEGSDVAYAQVTYTSLENLGVTKKHQFRLNLTDEKYPGTTVQTTVTVNRKLTYDYLGIGTCYDEYLFYETYDVEIYKAREAEVYRVMDPFSEGLEAEDYVKNGWATTPSAYIQIDCNSDGTIHFDEFRNGMYFQAMYYVYGIHPDDRTENLEKDCSMYVSKWTGDKEMTLYPFYYIKNYGYFDCFPMVITLP